MKAFKEYMKIRHGNDIIQCANELVELLKGNSSDSNMVWELLEQTGEDCYTTQTFINVAKILLS